MGLAMPFFDEWGDVSLPRAVVVPAAMPAPVPPQAAQQGEDEGKEE
jgi:hypothetical protein